MGQTKYFRSLGALPVGAWRGKRHGNMDDGAAATGQLATDDIRLSDEVVPAHDIRRKWVRAEESFTH